jgi:biotin synthase
MSTFDVVRAAQLVARGGTDAELRPLLLRLLRADAEEEHSRLTDAAYAVKAQSVGRAVYLRGLIEFSNVCVKDCLYCGIRRSNRSVGRYTMSREEIVAAARFAAARSMGSIVLQSGERRDSAFAAFVEDVLIAIHDATGNTLGITLSCGEQSRETYARWHAAGARRYLLRIESSDPSYYSRLHPASHQYERRMKCLRDLRECGYHVGTGVLIGAPGQTVDHLAEDLLFYRRADMDMIGMGPYVVHRDTPTGANAADGMLDRRHRLRLAIRMVALTRLLLPDVNIAAATALQALHPQGRELALRAGANVLMPIVTAKEYRQHYKLYDDRPCLEETAEQCHDCLDVRVASIGESIAYGVAGDPKHAIVRLGA